MRSKAPPTLEAFLARLYVDGTFSFRARLDPRGEAVAFGLDPASCDLVARIDWVALDHAAQSFAHKRAANPRSR